MEFKDKIILQNTLETVMKNLRTTMYSYSCHQKDLNTNFFNFANDVLFMLPWSTSIPIKFMEITLGCNAHM
jgi:hypothetical protein